MTTREAVAARLEEFDELARQFLDAARADDLDAMEEALEERRRLLDGLPAVSSEADAAALRDIVTTILERDAEAERILQTRHRELGEALRGLERGRQGLAGYRTGSGRTSKCIDERG